MQSKHILNTFTEGMVKDIEPAMLPQGTYIEAWNAVLQNEDNFNLTNERANKLASEFNGEIVGYMRVPDRNQTIFFVKGASSAIHIFNHENNTTKKVIEDSDYGCSWNFDECEWILGENKRLQPCNEFILYFSSGCTYYRINVDEVLDPKRAANLKCEDFLLFRCVCAPTTQPFVLENAGKDLPAGAYQFSVQLEDKDGNSSNWFFVGEPVYLGSDNNDPAEMSKDGITLSISNLDPKYSRVNVAVVRTVGGATTAYLITKRTYQTDGVTVEYTSTDQHEVDLPLEEILIKKKTYLKGKRLFQKDGRLFLYQLKQEANLNYQRQANDISSKYRVYKVPAEEAWRFKSLLRDEVYAFGIIWEYCDGTYSPVFHIPNNVAKPSGTASSCSDCEVPEWLLTSSARRTATYCGQNIFAPLEEICYCPPNAQCDEDCNVIIGEEPDDEEDDQDACIEIYINITFPPGCTNKQIQVEVDYREDGEFYGVIPGGNPPFTIGGFGDSNPVIIRMPITSQDFDIFSVRVFSTGGCDPLTYTYRIEDCVDPLQGEAAPRASGVGGSEQQGTCSGKGCSGNKSPNAKGNAADVHYNKDIRPNYIHQKEYDKERCRDAGQFVTDAGDIINCAECAASAASSDVPKVLKQGSNYLEQIRDLMRKDDEVRASPSLNTSANIPDAAGQMCGSIEDLERQKKKQAEYKKGGSNIDALLSIVESNSACDGEPIFADDGCTIIGYKPALVAEGEVGYWESCELYPNDLDCDGIPIYGDLAGTPIKHHKMPDVKTEPIFESLQVGVENFKEPDNFPTNDSWVFILGMEFGNIQQPANPPKPICGYRIVMAKRDGNNKSVIGKGLFTHTFSGDTYGKTYAIPKHGVNSFEYVDRHIENGEEENHLGEKWGKPIFGFHSIDVNTFRPFLNADYVKLDYETFGRGFKYGNYANGAPVSNANISRHDRRGVRSNINLNRINPLTEAESNHCIGGITYADENSIVKKADGIDHSIMNKYREKAVYLQTDTNFPSFKHPDVAGLGGTDPYIDFSFIGDGVDHPQPVNIAVAHVGALKSYNKCQYGNLESLTYVGTPLQGKGLYVEGQLGDVHIGLYSFKRSGYVSNKVGDILNEQFADIAGGRITRTDYLGVSPRTVCMPPNRRGANLEEDLGMYDTEELPETGDTRHPKNMASLHPTRRWNEVFNQRIVEPESDVFYPRTQTTLIHFWTESEINQKYRRSGEEELGEIFYPKLKGYDLDSEMPPSKVADNGWLNRFHQRAKKMSKVQLATRTAIRAFVKLGLPGIYAAMVAGTDTGLELASTLALSPLFITVWLVIERFIASNRNLNKILGIDECLIDEEGAQEKEDIRGFEDNFHKYSLDYSHINEINPLYNVPANYNTCTCDDCINQPNNEIYYSNKQAIDSSVDAYRNFNANDYLNIPAHAGVLQNLFIRQNRFYAHTTDAIWLLQYNNTAIPSDNGFIILGTGDLLSEPNQILEGVLEGSAGIMYPKSAINTKYGYFFVDDEARKIYRFSDEGLDELNAINSGMYNFFRKHLPQCVNTCKETPHKFGVDYENNRILFSTNGYTISYDMIRKKFVSFHSYVPEYFIFDRYNFYSIKDRKIWKHNEGGFQEFYGEIAPFSIEYAVNQSSARSRHSFIYENSVVDTEANRWVEGQKVTNLPITFDRMWAINSHQLSGEMSIEVDRANSPTNLLEEMQTKSDTIRWFREGMNYRYNQIRDNIVSPQMPILLTSECNIEKRLNPANYECKKTWDATHNFRDKYLIKKYIFDTYKDVQLVLKSVFTRIKNSEEEQQ